MIRIGGVPVTYPFAWVSTAFPLISRTFRFRRHFGVLGSIVAVATLLLVAVLPLVVGPGASAQSQFATLSGTVTDSSGAIVSGAAVTLKYSASGETRKTVTNDDGFFSVPTLPAGTYDVTVEIQGFQTWHGRNIVLNGSDSRTMKIEMKVGAVSERIEVQAAYDLVTIDSGEKSALISSEELQHLSLVGRNASEFIKILPGATLAANNGINKSAYSGEVVGINGF